MHAQVAIPELFSGVFIRNGGMEWWNGTVEWNGGMEQWNGMVEWNSGTTSLLQWNAKRMR